MKKAFFILSFFGSAAFLQSCQKDSLTSDDPILSEQIITQNINPKNGTNEKTQFPVVYMDVAPEKNNRIYVDRVVGLLLVRVVGCHDQNQGNCLATIDVDALEAQQPSTATAVNHAITAVRTGTSNNITTTFSTYSTELISVFNSSIVNGVINETYTVSSTDFPDGAIGEFIIDGDTINIDSNNAAHNYTTFYFSDNNGVIAEAPIALGN